MDNVVKQNRYHKKGTKMDLSFYFIFNSLLFGVGLAMDSFSVSIGNALKHPDMKPYEKNVCSATFGFFQGAMPLLGWVLVNAAFHVFSFIRNIVPYVALILLLYIGINMIREGYQLSHDDDYERSPYNFGELMLQAVATSIDALSVGLVLSEYSFIQMLECSVIIAVVTFLMCILATHIGKALENKLKNRSLYVGGAILIFIGLEIFIKNVFM